MKNERGITLIELVIVLALLGVVVSMMVSPIVFTYNNFNNQNERTNIISNARETMDYLTREIRKSNAVDIVGNEIIINSSVYRLEDRVLYKDDKKIIEGIDELNINKTDNTINIEIVIKDSGGKDHILSSTINIR